ncbi:butyrophilin-like protein 3 isoform X2 [Solea solea]|uniref:butyrophilin-like protein 3 isoform X2 n=1 Tax=Solea solea TaxID=90069 RepID=UPI00272A47E9|nr:butyrophilin-like protein 3 isoform X2 [Solea solea]
MILRDTRIEDTGNYTCVLPHVSSRGQRSTTELIVGAVHAPYLKIVGVSEAGVELQCVVRGSSSKPSVEWQTCEGTSLNSEEPLVSETRGRYDTTLLVTVNETKTNCFRCVVKQEDIYHRIDDDIVVPEKLFEKNSSHKTRDLVARGNNSGHGCDTGALVGMWVFGAAVVVVALLGALTLCWLRRRNTRRRRRGAAQANASGDRDGDAVEQEPGRMSRHGSAKSGTSTNSRSSYCNVSSNRSSPPPSPAPRSTSGFPPPTSPLVLSSLVPSKTNSM